MGRWDDLFADLAGQFEAAEAAELDVEVRELAQAAWARLSLAERMRAAGGRRVRLGLGELSVDGELRAVGPDWVLLADDRGEVLVPLAALQDATGLPPRGLPAPSTVASRLGLAYALRRIAADRAPVQLIRRAGAPLRALLLRVGADHVDVTPEGPAPAGAPSHQALSVPFSALLAVRRL